MIRRVSRSTGRRGGRRRTLLLLAAFLVSCAHGAFDVEALTARHPALARIEGHRLGQGSPYLLPRHDALHWFVCRWQLPRPLRVALPDGLDARDRELLLLALESLSRAVGVRFATQPSTQAPDVPPDITVEVGSGDGFRSGRTGADCAVRARGNEVAAELVHAEVSLQRTNPDLIGRPVALSEAEWLGAAIHELGHALGFQGHVRSGPGPMVRNVEQVRAIGRRVLRGEALSAPTLRALYALPSGTLLRRDALPPGRTRAIDRLDVLARERGYRGPFVRVGDVSALVDWRDPHGRVVGVWLPDLAAVRNAPDRLRIEPDPVAAAWLGP